MGAFSNNFDNVPLLLTVIILNLVTFTIGTIFSWPSPALPKLNGSSGPDFNPLSSNISSQEESWLAAVSLLAACVGSIIPSLMIKRLGRKITLMILTVPSFVGYLMLAFGANIAVYFVARVFCGITLGAGFQIVPMYVGEISEVKNRGAMGCYAAIFMAMGHVFNFSLGPFVSFLVHNVCLAIFPAMFLVLTFLFVQESPYDYVAKEDFVSAEKILRKLRCNSSDEDIKSEMLEIAKCVKSLQEQLKFKDLFQAKALRKSLIICIGLAIFQQFSGINAVMSYMQTIFDAAGSTIEPEISPIYVAIVQLLATLVTPHVVDRFGRKILLAISNFGLFVSMTGLGTFFFLDENGYNTDQIFWLPLLSLIVFIIFFNTGPGSVIFVIMGEIFPSNAKNVSSTITSFSLTIFGFAVTWIFPLLVDHIQLGFTFWIAALLSLLGFLMVVVLVPETKGRSFIEIQELLNK